MEAAEEVGYDINSPSGKKVNFSVEKKLSNSFLIGRFIFKCMSHVNFPTLQRQNIEISKQIFPEKECRGLSPSFHILVSVSDLYISTIGLPILLDEICRPILGLYKSLTYT